jgi:hypothetical protein
LPVWWSESGGCILLGRLSLVITHEHILSFAVGRSFPGETADCISWVSWRRGVRPELRRC